MRVPKTVAPAYRLHTALPGGRSPEDAPDQAVDSSRPKLVLLRPTDDAAAADVDGDDGSHYERVGVLDRPEPVCLPDVGVALPTMRREQARRRCTTLLRCLGGVAVSTGLIGLFPGMHLAWVFTGLSGLAALGLVGLMAYAKELEAEQDRRRSRREVARPGAAERDGDGRLPGSLGRRRLRSTAGRRPLNARPPGGPHTPTILEPSGGVAQLAERYVRNVEAVGSNPITSTRKVETTRRRGC